VITTKETGKMIILLLHRLKFVYSYFVDFRNWMSKSGHCSSLLVLYHV